MTLPGNARLPGLIGFKPSADARRTRSALGRRCLALCCWSLVCLGILGCKTTKATDAANQPATPKPVPKGTFLVEPEVAFELGYMINWSAKLALDSDGTLFSVKRFGDLIVTVERPRNLVSAVSAKSGQVLWRKAIGTGEIPIFAPVFGNGWVMVNLPGEVHCINAKDGKTELIFQIKNPSTCAPVINDNLAIFGGVNGRVFAHDFRTGSFKWAYKMASEIRVSPVNVSDTVFVADASGVYAHIEADTGRLLWRGRTFNTISAQAAVDNVSIFVPSEDRTLYALDRTTGRDRWDFRTDRPLTQSPMSYRLALFLPVPNKELVALNSVNGAEKWRYKKAVKPVGVVNDQLLVMTPRELELMDMDSGRAIVSLATNRPISHALLGDEGDLVLVSPRGEMLRLAPR